MNDDADLHERFQSLRREDAVRARSFDGLLRMAARARPGAGALPTALLASAAGLVLAGAAMFLWRIESHGPAAGRSLDAPPLADWRSPTDFLLDTPASTLLREVPRIGDPRLDQPAPAHRRTQERPT